MGPIRRGASSDAKRKLGSKSTRPEGARMTLAGTEAADLRRTAAQKAAAAPLSL